MYKKIFIIVVILVILAVILVIFKPKIKNNNNVNNRPDSILNVEEEQEIVFQDLFAPEVMDMIEQGVEFIIIDVSNKYDMGHLPGAINFYVIDGTLDSAINSLDKSRVYLIYSHDYDESVAGAQKMTNAGFEMIYRLEGGYEGWIFEGYAVE